jgi:hypothetical protein
MVVAIIIIVQQHPLSNFREATLMITTLDKIDHHSLILCHDLLPKFLQLLYSKGTIILGIYHSIIRMK